MASRGLILLVWHLFDCVWLFELGLRRQHDACELMLLVLQEKQQHDLAAEECCLFYRSRSRSSEQEQQQQH